MTPMLARWWYQHSELIQKLQGCEIKNSLPIGPGFRETVNQPLILPNPLQPLAGENGTGTVAKQALQPGTITGCYSDVGV